MNMQPSSATIDLMNQKYSILGRHADAAMLGAQAAMTNARNEAALTARRQDLMGAQAGESQQRGGLYGAEAGKTGVEAQWLPSVYRSNIGLTNAQARGANTGASVLANEENTGLYGGPNTGNEYNVDSNGMLSPNPSYAGVGMSHLHQMLYGGAGNVGYGGGGGGMLTPQYNINALSASQLRLPPVVRQQQQQQQQPDIPAPDMTPRAGMWQLPGADLQPQDSTAQAPASPYTAAPGPASSAGYYNGVPVPTGASARPAGPASGPGGSSNPVGPWGERYSNDPNVPSSRGISGRGVIPYDPAGTVIGGSGDFEVSRSTPVVYQSAAGGPQRALGTGKVVPSGSTNYPRSYEQEDNNWGGGSGGRKQAMGFSKGTSKVPGKGAKGLVKAKLAPGEAVLNNGAADHMGRGLIAALNTLAHHGGLSSQQPTLGGVPHAHVPQSIGGVPGLPPPSAGMGAVPGASGPASGGAAPMGSQGFAKGTANVPLQQAQGGKIGQAVKLQGTTMGGSPTPALMLSKGTAKVPGKGSSKVDSVPATLAPGEAVLTADAANHVGRGLIAHLNALHAHEPPMGMLGGQNQPTPANNLQRKPSKAAA